jgi:hypothetical protein
LIVIPLIDGHQQKAPASLAADLSHPPGFGLICRRGHSQHNLLLLMIADTQVLREQ